MIGSNALSVGHLLPFVRTNTSEAAVNSGQQQMQEIRLPKMIHER
jgi:hypothetical protein